nr:NADH dehydrogenase subunit 3 [Rhynchopus humris]
MLATGMLLGIHVLLASVLVHSILAASTLIHSSTLLSYDASSYECGIVATHSTSSGWCMDTLYLMPVLLSIEMVAVLLLAHHHHSIMICVLVSVLLLPAM